MDTYVIEYTRLSNNEVTRVSVNGSETSTYIDDLLPGSYQLKIAVENENGLSDFGSSISFVVPQTITEGNNNGNNNGNNDGGFSSEVSYSLKSIWPGVLLHRISLHLKSSPSKKGYSLTT